MKTNKITILLIGVLLVGGLSYWFTRDNSADKELTEVRLATSYNAWCGLPIIALEKGYFEEEGLKIDLTVQPVGKLCVDALRSSSVDIATAVEVNFAYVGFSESTDLRLVTSIVKSDSSAIVARRSSGIESAKDLSGKSIALIPGTTTQLFANRVIDKHGIQRDSVDIRAFQPNAILAALIAGDVDSASIWEPLVDTAAAKLGNEAVIIRDSSAYTGYMTVAVREKWALKNKETLKKFVKALEKALLYTQTNEAEAQAIIANKLKVDPTTIARIWPYFSYRVDPSMNEIKPAMEREGKWIRETQKDYQDKPAPDYSIFFNKEILIDSSIKE